MLQVLWLSTWISLGLDSTTHWLLVLACARMLYQAEIVQWTANSSFHFIPGIFDLYETVQVTEASLLSCSWNHWMTKCILWYGVLSYWKWNSSNGKEHTLKKTHVTYPKFCVYLLIWICLNKQLFTTFNAPGLLTKILTQCSFQLLSIQVKVVHFNHIMKTSVERWCHFPVVANLLAFMILLWSAIYFLL